MTRASTINSYYLICKIYTVNSVFLLTLDTFQKQILLINIKFCHFIFWNFTWPLTATHCQNIDTLLYVPQIYTWHVNLKIMAPSFLYTNPQLKNIEEPVTILQHVGFLPCTWSTWLQSPVSLRGFQEWSLIAE